MTFSRLCSRPSLDALREAFQRDGFWSGELVHTTKDGRTLTVESRQQLLIADGRSLVLETNRDVTERRRTEEERERLLADQQMLNEELASQTEELVEREGLLRESEERFRTMADAIPQLAWIANADGYIYWYNQRWYEYTGTTLAEMEGWGWQSVHDPEPFPAVLAALARSRSPPASPSTWSSRCAEPTAFSARS